MNQLMIDYTQVLHKRENNPESQRNLEENFYKFTGQCAVVFSLLQKGAVLTVALAYGMKPRITSLPRRILDLKKRGVPIEDRWVYTANGKRDHKQYFIQQKINSHGEERNN